MEPWAPKYGPLSLGSLYKKHIPGKGPYSGPILPTLGFKGPGFRVSGRNLIKQPWAFIGVPYMNPTILGVIDPGFLNQVPTLNPINPIKLKS